MLQIQIIRSTVGEGSLDTEPTGKTWWENYRESLVLPILALSVNLFYSSFLNLVFFQKLLIIFLGSLVTKGDYWSPTSGDTPRLYPVLPRGRFRVGQVPGRPLPQGLKTGRVQFLTLCPDASVCRGTSDSDSEKLGGAQETAFLSSLPRFLPSPTK